MLKDRDKSLFTTSEWRLLRASQSPDLEELGASALKTHMKRARGLADKFVDLSRSRHRTSKRRAGREHGRSPDTLRKERKAKLFKAAATRFERQLSRVSVAGTSTKPGAIALAPSSGARGGATTQREQLRRRRQRRQEASDRAQKIKAKRQFERKNVRTIQGHIRARTQRSQARRDSRS